ncbi:LuxR family transcriptional activator of conjugal transfer of Ti plasmids [Bradyrhizobium yuanmingense]
MADLATSLNLSSFAYLRPPEKSGHSPTVISTYPTSWTEHYLRRHYERIDPVVSQATRHTRPFRWGLGFGPPVRSRNERELFEEAAGFGIRYGFTIPIHDSRGAIAIVTFATDQRRTEFEKSIRKHGPVLRVMAMYFDARARPCSSADRQIDGVLLSPREIECLEWYSRGKTAWEIGTILGITPRTVAFHRDNARTKLGVRTIQQAIVRLTESKHRK